MPLLADLQVCGKTRARRWLCAENVSAEVWGISLLSLLAEGEVPHMVHEHGCVARRGLGGLTCPLPFYCF